MITHAIRPPTFPIPDDVQRAWWDIRKCVMYRRERIRMAKHWARRGRPAMAHDAVESAREWNQKAREIGRQLQR